MTARLRVTLCTLGGTIAAVARRGALGVVPTSDSPLLTERLAVPGLHLDIDEHSVGHLPSAATDFGTLRQVLNHAERAAEQGVDGVVITSGTDMLEEVAFALDLQWTRTVPMVITGAMRHPGLSGPDGTANLLAALRVVADPRSRDLGCVVVMNDRIHAPCQLQKRHSTNVDAFVSALAGPLGEVSEGTVRLFSRPLLGPTVRVSDNADFGPVALIRPGLGDDGRLLDCLLDLGYRGLVVEAAGGGSVPPAWMRTLEQLAGQIPVIYASRTAAGPALRSTYGGPGGEIDLQEKGLIPAGLLDGLKARVLLTLLLAADTSWSDIRDTMCRYSGQASLHR